MVVKKVESVLDRVLRHAPHTQSEVTVGDDQDHDIYGLLLESGGRIRQQEVVAQTEMSAPRVSKQLTAMEENKDIVRVKVGREKIVCLPELVPNQQL